MYFRRSVNTESEKKKGSIIFHMVFCLWKVVCVAIATWLFRIKINIEKKKKKKVHYLQKLDFSPDIIYPLYWNIILQYLVIIFDLVIYIMRRCGLNLHLISQ